MICRLCLCDLDDAVSIYIFSDVEHGLPKAIAKYLQLEVTLNDNISTQLCSDCWRYLTEFEQFCAMVLDKQQALLLKTEPEPPPEPAVVVWNTESPLEMKLTFDDDIKDHILCEPEIDVQQKKQTFERGYSSSSSGRSFDEQEPQDDIWFAEACEPAKKLSRKRRTRAASSNKLPHELSSSLRETRARCREQRRNATAPAEMEQLEALLDESKVESKAGSEMENKAESRAPFKAESKESKTAPKTTSKPTSKKPPKVKRKTQKRGRPKGSVNGIRTIRTKSEPSELAAKRSSIKHMDDYIAANVKLDCCLCAAPLQDFIELKRHFRSEHNCTGYMECCNNRYKKRTLYVDHLHFHKDPQYFSCKSCCKNFQSRNSQDMHMLRFHSDQQQRVHQCGICEMRFAKKFLLTMHMKGHKGIERPEACETCQKTFRTKLELTAHIKRMHTSDFTPVICDICGVNFRSKANFLIHKKALHPDGPIAEVQCKLCSRWLRDERSLRKHLQRHDDRDGSNKYRCVLCGAEKASRVALSSHMRYHHSTKRHSCTLCGKEFKLPRALAEHMATHTGIDLYSCAFCTRTFKSHANMHNHKKKMHPNEWVRKYTMPSASGAGSGTGTVSLPATELEMPDMEEQMVNGLETPAVLLEKDDDIEAKTAVVNVDYEFLDNAANVCTL